MFNRIPVRMVVSMKEVCVSVTRAGLEISVIRCQLTVQKRMTMYIQAKSLSVSIATATFNQGVLQRL